jgi:hypothetical protein
MDWLEAPCLYVYGDANGDGIVDISNMIYLISYLLIGGPSPDSMVGDANGDCVIDASDVVYLLNYLFVHGSIPKEGCA